MTLCWVPAHISVRGNEDADEVARSAACRPPSQCALPFSDLHLTRRSSPQKEWKRTYEAVIVTTKMGEVTTSRKKS